nr:oxygen-independent coproporphyrinogen III oxidase [Rudaea cellulosilytica]
MTTPMSSAIPQFDAELIARHDVAGPRYTSYPTAPQFHVGFDELAFRAVACASNEDPIPRRLSLYVHVPFCASPCFYCGCTRVITRDHGKAEIYLDHLYREIELVAPLFDRDRPLVQLHFGGGTPNFLDDMQMSELLESLARQFSFSRDADREFGIELDPRWCGPDYVRMLATHGFNRISVGIQDFDRTVQAAINRIQSVEETRAVLDAARASGFRSTSVDLIYGLPKQTVANFRRTLEQVIELAPDRVATYAYAHLPDRFKAQRRINAADLPSAAQRLELLGLTVEMLTAAGYRYIGMDHFARPNDDLARAQEAGTLQRNFQGYSTHGDCDLIGLGVSAISHVGATFSQNERELRDYYAALEEGRLPIVRGIELDDDDALRADVIQQLMCQGRLDIASVEARHRIDFTNYFGVELERLRIAANDGLVEITPENLAVTPRGRFLLRNIAMCFDAYLHAPAAVAARYSRAL